MIDPVVLTIGILQIRWYGIIIAAAFLVGIALAYRRAERNNIDPNHILSMVTLIIPAAIIGARLYYVAFTWDDYRDDPLAILATWHGGLALHGGIIGGLLAGLFYVSRHRLSVWLTADIIAPSVILGQAIGRWGNFINREAYGNPVTEQFINYFPDFIKKQMYIAGQYHHPAFLYESLWNFSVFLFLTWYWPRKKANGEIAFLYLIFYSAGRFFIESIRTDSLMLGPYRVAQLVSLLLIMVSIAGIAFLRFKNKDPRPGGKPG